jgi:hypothetical protein
MHAVRSAKISHLELPALRARIKRHQFGVLSISA